MRNDRLEEIRSAVADAATVSIRGLGGYEAFAMPRSETSTTIALEGHSGIVDYSPDDQVVVVRSGTPVDDLNEQLGRCGQCIPLGSHWIATGQRTVGGSLSMNLPHTREGSHGNWRDWVLGMRVVMADGAVASSGSKVVKSVAGYDAHKLFIGARGTLGVVVEVTLRTAPLCRAEAEAALQPPAVLQRVLMSDFETASASLPPLAAADQTTGTLAYPLAEGEAPTRYPGDWLVRAGCGSRNLVFEDSTSVLLMRRAKAVFDPGAKLNPGVLGIF